MPQTTITAGLSIKRPGAEQYSSDGYHLTVEMEADIEDAAQFRAVTKALFSEVKKALEAEISGGASPQGSSSVDLWAAPSGGNGHNGHGGKPATRQDASSQTLPSDRARSHAPRSGGNGAQRTEPISNKQAKFLWQLARKSGMRTQAEVADWIAEKLGVERGVYELTKVEASKAIDLLNNNGNGGAKR